SGRRVLGGRIRASRLPSTKSWGLHLPFRPAPLEIAASHQTPTGGSQIKATSSTDSPTRYTQMPTTITAAVARTHKAPLSIETLHLDHIRPNEARVRLVATGVCHTDAIVR